MNYYLHKFGVAYATATVLPVLGAEQQIGPDSVLPTNVVLPGGVTFDTRGTGQALPSGHTLTATGFYQAANEAALQVLVDAMRAWIGEKSKLWLLCADNTVRWRYARLLSAPTQHLARGHGRFRQPMELVFELDDMLWCGRFLTKDVVTLADSPELAEIDNAGTRVVGNVIITAAAIGYDITQLDIQNLEADHRSHIRFMGTIAEGTSLVIDCGEMTVKNNGVDAWDDLSRESAHQIHEWLRLAADDGQRELGSEMHTAANAASDPNENEANATTGWSVRGTCILSSSSVSPLVGFWCLKGTADVGSNEAIKHDFATVAGRVYRVSIWAKRGAKGVTQLFRDWEGCTIPVTAITTTTWTEYVFYVTATSTNIEIRVYANSESAPIDDEVYVDNVSIRRVHSGNTISVDRNEELGAEIHTQANAASDPNGNEANSTAGWSALGLCNIISSAASPKAGSYSIKGTAGDATNEGIKRSFTAVIGKFYKIVIWAKRGAQGTTQRFYNWQGCTDLGALSIGSTTWTEYIFNVTATATTIEIRVYANQVGATGDEVYVDNVSIKEVTGGGSRLSTCKFTFHDGYA